MCTKSEPWIKKIEQSKSLSTFVCQNKNRILQKRRTETNKELDVPSKNPETNRVRAHGQVQDLTRGLRYAVFLEWWAHPPMLTMWTANARTGCRLQSKIAETLEARQCTEQK